MTSPGFNPPTGSVPSGIGGPQSGATPPAWAGTAKNIWTPNNSAYNDVSASKLNSRLAAANAVLGSGLFDVAVIGGASMELGYNGVGLTQDSTKSWVRQFVVQLASLLGGLAVTDGIVPASGQDDRWAKTGGAQVLSTVPSFIWMNGAGTTTVVTLAGGTSVRLFYPSSNTSTMTWTVDGTAGPALVPSGVNVMNSQVLSGLTNAAHTIVVTNPSGSSFVGGYALTGQTSGIRLSNLALGGTNASTGTQYTNWSDHTNALSISDSRNGMLTTAGISPQLGILDLGANDAFHGATVAQYAAGLADIVAKWLPVGCDLEMVNTWNISGVSDSAFVPYQTAAYAQANASGARMLDFHDIIGTLAIGVARGWVGPDNTHPTYPASVAIGRLNALAFMS